MVKKLASFLLVVCSMLVLLSVGVFGAISWTSPSAGTTLKSTSQAMTCTSTINGTVAFLFEWRNESESYNVIHNATVEEVNVTTLTITNDTSVFVDTNTGTANCTVWWDIGAGIVEPVSATRDFNLDNNAPSSIVIDILSKVEILSPVGLTAVCSGSDVNADVYKVSLKNQKGEFVVTNRSIVDGDSSDRTRLRGTDWRSYGRHEAFCTLCDTASFCTDSDAVSVSVTSKDGAEEDAIVEEEEKKDVERKIVDVSNNVIIVGGVAVVVIVVAMLFMFFPEMFGVKKRRR